MMNSKHKATAVIDEVLKLTSDEYLHRQIDLPIEKAYMDFSFDRSVPVTPRNFTRITGELVRHIHRYGSAMKRTLSKSQARGEALSMIEEGYEIPDTRGYDAAYLDALRPDGLESVLVWIAGFIIARERDRHVKWIYTSRVNPFDWNNKCLMVEILLAQWGRFLPSGVTAYMPAQLVSSLPELFRKINSANSEVERTLSGGGDFYGSETLAEILPLFE